MKKGTRKATTQPLEGAAMRELREKVGLKQSELAKRSGVSQNLICFLEKGVRNFTPGTRENLWAVLLEAEKELLLWLLRNPRAT